MTLPSSGTMTAAMINTELGRTATAAFNMNGSAERALPGRSSGQISMSHFYGKSNTPPIPGTLRATFSLGVANLGSPNGFGYLNTGKSTQGTLSPLDYRGNAVIAISDHDNFNIVFQMGTSHPSSWVTAIEVVNTGIVYQNLTYDSGNFFWYESSPNANFAAYVGTTMTLKVYGL